MSAELSRRLFVVGAVVGAAALGIRNVFARSQKVHEIDIKSFKFEPQHIRVEIGDRIRWTNRDLAPHTATAEEFGWDTGELATGANAEIVVTVDMETQYFCVFHAHMKGSIEIVSSACLKEQAEFRTL